MKLWFFFRTTSVEYIFFFLDKCSVTTIQTPQIFIHLVSQLASVNIGVKLTTKVIWNAKNKLLLSISSSFDRKREKGGKSCLGPKEIKKLEVLWISILVPKKIIDESKTEVNMEPFFYTGKLSKWNFISTN